MARIPDDVDRLKQTVSLQQKTGSDSNYLIKAPPS